MVIALFCRLQGTTMEHNQDVYHVSRFPKIEPRTFKSKYGTTVKQTYLPHVSYRHNGLPR